MSAPLSKKRAKVYAREGDTQPEAGRREFKSGPVNDESKGEELFPP